MIPDWNRLTRINAAVAQKLLSMPNQEKEPFTCLCSSAPPDGGSLRRGCGQAAIAPGWSVYGGYTFKVRLVVTDVFSRSAEAAIIPLGAARLHAPFSAVSGRPS